MTQQERDQWRVHAATLRQRAEDAKASGKWGEARKLEQAAQEVERRVEAECAMAAGREG